MLVCRDDLYSDYDDSIDEDYAPPSSAETDEYGANNDVEGPADEEANGKVLTGKRQRDPSTWMSNVRKSLRQSGKQYTDSQGKL